MTNPHITQAVVFATKVPLYDAERPRNGRRWVEHPALCAEVVRCIYASEMPFEAACRCIANLLGGTGAITLLNLCNGQGSNRQPWPELRAELDQLSVPWSTRKHRGRAQGAARPVQQTEKTIVSWRVLPGTEHIEVTKVEVLAYGTDAHREFIRQHLSELGQPRPT